MRYKVALLFLMSQLQKWNNVVNRYKLITTTNTFTLPDSHN